ncbi:MAG: hypothetical protein AAGD38_21185 [Acidobacteriota bacterium]
MTATSKPGHGKINYRLWATALASVGLTFACSNQSEKPAALPSQTTAQVESEIEAPPPLPPPIRRTTPTTPSREAVKVIDDGRQNEPRTLVEASKLAKERKRDAAEPVAEINDENLAEYAEGGQVIIVEEPAVEPIDAAADTEPTSDDLAEEATATDELERDETYWRTRGLELRRRWRNTVEELERVELEAAALRQRFYAEDDPFVRDGTVKPAWDRSLDRITELQRDAERFEAELQTFLAEGRAAGAQPGWLREGWELEPVDNDDANDGLPIQDAQNVYAIDTPTIN